VSAPEEPDQPEPVRAYLAAFAEDRFFEAHEALEGLWWARGSDPFLQGLILFAAAYVKLARGSAQGAARHFRAAASYLAPYRPRHAGFDVAAVVAHAEAAAEALAPYAAPGGPPLPPDALGGLVPRFRFAVGPEVWVLGEPPARPTAAEGELEALVAAAVADRRAAGLPVGPASWAEVAKEVLRRGRGRFPRNLVRTAVRRTLGTPEAGSRDAV
jgi:hypothetical protein